MAVVAEEVVRTEAVEETEEAVVGVAVATETAVIVMVSVVAHEAEVAVTGAEEVVVAEADLEVLL